MGWLQFWLWVASFLISDYFRQRLPSQTPAGVGDFNIPTATEGRPAGVAVGTMRIDAPNCIWYGDFLADPKTVSTGVIFKEDEVVGYRYRLALQYALGKFRAAGMTGIWIGDEKVWDYVADNGGVPSTVADVIRYDLFGGSDSGGGFAARFTLFNGDDDQPVSSFLASRLDPLPAYRGTCYVMVTNTEETGLDGWRVVTSTPDTIGAYIGDTNQLRYIKIEVQCFDDLAGTAGSPGLGNDLGLAGDTHFIGPDLNPINFAWDLYRNDRWGRAFPLSDVDQASFQAAAATCFTEGIGFSYVFDEQVSTSQLQDIIEQHIEGYIGPNPVTGKIEVTLTRPDYVLANEFQATDDNIINVIKWNKGDWSQTANRTRIRYADRDKEWNETHAIELSPANRVIQGRTVTKELRFEGCHTASVAARLAARSNATLSLPQSSGTIELDRTAWAIRPGSVMSLTSSQAEETDLAVRVTKIELGDGIANSLKAEVVADNLRNEVLNVAEPPPTDFVPPVQGVIPFATDDQAAFETPFVMMRADTSPDATPRISTLARRAGANYATTYEVLRRTGNPPAGGYTSAGVIAAGFCAVGELRNAEARGQSGNGALTIQVDGISNESLDGLIGPYAPGLNNFAGVAVISPGLETEEFVIFNSIVDDGTGIRLEGVRRASMDTPWGLHAAGARIWFFWTGGLGLVPEIFTNGVQVEVKLLPTSPTDQVLEGDATALPIITIDSNTDDRASKPLVPAELTINGSSFPAQVDFDNTTTGLPSPDPDITGAVFTPTHKLWKTEDVVYNSEGLDVDGSPLEDAVLTGEAHRVSLWIHNLDEDPTANRANAVFSIIDQDAPDLTQGAPFNLYAPKSDLIAGGAVGQDFNARVEIETKHSPAGQAADNVSHRPLLFDFVALGVFSLTPALVRQGAPFNGNDTETALLAENNVDALFLGAAEIDTASSVFGGASLLLPGTAGDVVHLASPKGFRWYDADWTMDFRIRFDDIVTNNQVIVGAGWLPFRRTWYLQWNNTSFNLLFSRSGNDGPFTNIGLGSFSPVAGQWYQCRIVKKGVSPRFSLYFDGTRVGSTFTSQSHIDAGCDLVFGARYDGDGVYTNPFTGQIDDFAFYNLAAIDPNSTSYTVETTAKVGPLAVKHPIVANFEGADAATVGRTDDTTRWTLGFGATTQIDTAQAQFGSSSLLCNGARVAGTPASSDGVWLVESLGLTDPLPQFDLKTNDWTMQAFVRFIGLPSTQGGSAALISKLYRIGANFGAMDWTFGFSGSNLVLFSYTTNGDDGTATPYTATNTPALSTGVWYHVAVQRRGNDLEVYFQGNRLALVTDHFAGVTIVNSFDVPVTLGRHYDAPSNAETGVLNGWLDAAEVINGEALFSGATYTIPTAPPEPGRLVDKDLLLLHGWDGLGNNYAVDRAADTDDARRGTRFTFTQNAQVRTSPVKFSSPTTAGALLTGGSPSDGCVYTPSDFYWDLGNGDFTADIWFRRATSSINGGGIGFFSHWVNTGDQRGWRFAWNQATSELEFVWSTDGTALGEKRVFVSSVAVGTFPLNDWIHLAVERDGSNMNIYLDGVLQTLDVLSDSIGTDTIYNSPSAEIKVGRQTDAFTGYIFAYWDEFRITKGAKYGSASFTPETDVYPRPSSAV